jgi:hypothetical protein
MWAMIGTAIALGIWTAGLMWMSSREEKNRLLLVEQNAAAKLDDAMPVENQPFEEKV